MNYLSLEEKIEPGKNNIIRIFLMKIRLIKMTILMIIKAKQKHINKMCEKFDNQKLSIKCMILSIVNITILIIIIQKYQIFHP